MVLPSRRWRPRTRCPGIVEARLIGMVLDGDQVQPELSLIEDLNAEFKELARALTRD